MRAIVESLPAQSEVFGSGLWGFELSPFGAVGPALPAPPASAKRRAMSFAQRLADLETDLKAGGIGVKLVLRLGRPLQIFNRVVLRIPVDVVDLGLLVRIGNERSSDEAMHKMLSPAPILPQLDADISTAPDLRLDDPPEAGSDLTVLADGVAAEKVENLEFHFSPLSSSRASSVSRRPWLMSASPCSASTSE